jgi:hypothetical protein
MDPGRYYWISDPNFSIPNQIQGQKDSGSASKSSIILNPKNHLFALGNMIHPGSGIQLSKKHRIPDLDP